MTSWSRPSFFPGERQAVEGHDKQASEGQLLLPTTQFFIYLLLKLLPRRVQGVREAYEIECSAL